MIDRFETFVKSVNAAYKCIQKIKQYEMKMFGLKASHVMIMFSLGQHPEGLTAGELCRVCDIDKSAVSRILPVLYENGHVQGFKNDGQKYRVRNRLTEKGKNVCAQLNKFIEKVVTQVGDGLLEEERANFYMTFERITQNLNATCEQLGDIE